MKADFTRSTFDPKKHNHGVRQQQGRVQLDADWNEQVDLENYRIETGTVDLMGGSGGLLSTAGFKLNNGAVPTLSSGRFYVDGILVQNDQDGLKINEQPDLPGFNLPGTAGFYLATLDVWQRNITALEDPSIREVALGGPDTATRERTTWQVRLLGPYQTQPMCVDAIPDYDRLINPVPARGKMKAHTVAGSAANDLCSVPAGGGFRRLENQLYRVEIHNGDTRDSGKATFKWSRDNGSIVTSWLDQQGNDLVVSSIGKDQVLGFAPGQTVELSDDGRELRGEKGVLVHISNAEGSSAGSVLTLDASDPNTAGINKAAQFPDVNVLGDPNHPKVRRWDSDGEIPLKAGWIALEDGVEVSFEAGAYTTGDYWLIPARSATSDIEWPEDNAAQPIALDAFGITHHYCRLGILQFSAGVFTLLEDCRPLFPALTDLINFQVLSGDGQETKLNGVLPQLLMVGVTLGKWPLGQGPLQLKKFKVRFEVVNNAGFVDANQASAATSSKTFLLVDVVNGVAACAWKPANNPALTSQQLKATLYYFNGTVLTGHPSIIFNANLSLAGQVTYIPDGSCTELSGVNNVQDALDILCQVRQGKSCCYTVGEGGDFPTIDEAIKFLVEKGERQICLCLLPGVQTSDGIQIGSPDKSIVHLKIHGGAGSQLVLKNRWELSGFASFTMEDIYLTAPQTGDANPFFGLLNCGEVTLRGNHITAAGGSGTFLGIEALSTVTLQDNEIDVFNFSQVVGKVIEATPLVDILKIADLSEMHFVANKMVSGDLITIHAAERRVVSKKIARMVESNPASLTNDQILAINAVSNAMNAGRVDKLDLERSIGGLLKAGRVPGRAIFFFPTPAQVFIQNNIIIGQVSFYGPAMKDQLDPEKLMGLAHGAMDIIKKGDIVFKSNDAALQMHHNTLTNLTVGDEVFSQMVDLLTGKTKEFDRLFLDAVLHGNSFGTLANIHIAVNLNFQGNAFHLAGGAAMLCVAETGVYVGNRGTKPGSLLAAVNVDRQEAANLRLQIL